MNKTEIAWTDFSSNPIKFRNAEGRTVWGCVRVSPGCTNCYASALKHRFQGAEFTAKEMLGLTPFVDEKEISSLLSPRRLPAGSRVFVGDMTDIFGEWVTDEMLDRPFAVFALRPDVVFQLLTKRPERMRAYMTAKQTFDGILVAGRPVAGEGGMWPLPNVWLGTSVEDQQRAGERIPELLACPAAVRFISAEPALGPVDLTALDKTHETDPGFSALTCGPDDEGTIDTVIDWVIVGGESGPGARPMDVAWARSLVSQCQAAGVAVFYKQGGSAHRCPHSAKGGCFDCMPADLRVREFPGVRV